VIPFHIAFCYLFVHYLGLGLKGAAYACNLTAVLTLFMQIAYAIRLKEISAAFYWPTKRAFRNLWPFFMLAAPGSLMLILEYLNWEILVLIAGTFNDNSLLAAMVIICTVGGSLITIPYGMSISAVAMVGNALGSNKPNEAKSNAKLIMTVSVIVSLSVTMTMSVFKETII
jgi:MATE family multidrug resistance protein